MEEVGEVADSGLVGEIDKTPFEVPLLRGDKHSAKFSFCLFLPMDVLLLRVERVSIIRSNSSKLALSMVLDLLPNFWLLCTGESGLLDGKLCPFVLFLFPLGKVMLCDCIVTQYNDHVLCSIEGEMVWEEIL